MSDLPTTSPNIILLPPKIPLTASERRQRWVEVWLVLLAACGSSFLHSLYILRNGPNAVPTNSNERWLLGIFQEVVALFLLTYVLSRRSLSFKDIGLSWRLKDVLAGLLVIGFSYVAYVFGSMLVQTAHHLIYGAFAKSLSGKDFYSHPPFAAIPFSLLNPFFEELIVRAYLMTEVSDLTGSSTLAVAVSVAVQFSYHLYYGWVGAISLSFSFWLSRSITHAHDALFPLSLRTDSSTFMGYSVCDESPTTYFLISVLAGDEGLRRNGILT